MLELNTSETLQLSVKIQKNNNYNKTTAASCNKFPSTYMHVCKKNASIRFFICMSILTIMSLFHSLSLREKQPGRF